MKKHIRIRYLTDIFWHYIPYEETYKWHTIELVEGGVTTYSTVNVNGILLEISTIDYEQIMNNKVFCSSYTIKKHTFK